MSKKTVISNGNVPKSPLPFSPGIISGDYLFVSGQASVDHSGSIVNDTFEGECRRSFDNLKRIVEAAGASLDDAVQVRNYVGKQEYLAEFNAIYREYFNEPYPARTTLIGCLGELLKFEVDVVVNVGK
ncbi:RidA family protein [Dyadobacter sp. CY327]|uniref:RidA family protein n=1 Tax=Dyadobacter sp. CY327 TaxID=2907301 RepID=UPI001F2FD8E3|nr:RidA family protein [Dyadobacter sp. CY327]MCE7070859.1 RidA family protein [Dyadobacter sp. CY327]